MENRKRLLIAQLHHSSEMREIETRPIIGTFSGSYNYVSTIFLLISLDVLRGSIRCDMLLRVYVASYVGIHRVY